MHLKKNIEYYLVYFYVGMNQTFKLYWKVQQNMLFEQQQRKIILEALSPCTFFVIHIYTYILIIIIYIYILRRRESVK